MAATIPCGKNVLFDLPNTAVTPVQLSLLNISGVLKIWDNPRVGNVDIHAHHVLVTGRLIVGAPTAQFQHKVRFFLAADPVHRSTLVVNGHDYGHKAFVIANGRVSLHGMPGGAATPSWVKLTRPAAKGDTKIFVDQDVSRWPLAGALAIAPSDCRYQHAESPALAAVARLPGGAAGSVLTLSAPLQFPHWGGTLATDFPGRTVDASAEVGLLTRNIKIEGEAEVAPGYELEGGHFISAYTRVPQAIEGVEFYRLGQQGVLGRYPVHFHFNLHVPGSYVRSCAVHASLQRCVVVHATHDVLVEGNVAYDTAGHCFVTEDGLESNNRFLNNLGMLTRAVQVLIPSGGPTDGPGFPRNDDQPATFWMANPNNTLVGNHAGGSERLGIWYNLHTAVNGLSYYLPGAGSVNPSLLPFQRFDLNVVHSSFEGFSTYFSLAPPPAPGGAYYTLLSRLTAYRVCGLGAVAVPRSRRLLLDGFTLFANGLAVDTSQSNDNVLRNALIVGSPKTAAFINAYDVVAYTVGVNLGYWDHPLDVAGLAPGGAWLLDGVAFSGFYSTLGGSVGALVLGCNDRLCAAPGYNKGGTRLQRSVVSPESAQRVALGLGGGADLVQDVDGTLVGAPSWLLNSEDAARYAPPGRAACAPSAAMPTVALCPLASMCIRSVSIRSLVANSVAITVVRADTGQSVPVGVGIGAYYFNVIAGVLYDITPAADLPSFYILAQGSACPGLVRLNLRVSEPNRVYTFAARTNPLLLPRPCPSGSGGGGEPPASPHAFFALQCGPAGGAASLQMDLGGSGDGGSSDPAITAGSYVGGTPSCDASKFCPF